MPALFFPLKKKVAAGGDNGGRSAGTAESAAAAEQKALEDLGALLERKAEADKKVTGASLESMLAGMEVRGGGGGSFLRNTASRKPRLGSRHETHSARHLCAR